MATDDSSVCDAVVACGTLPEITWITRASYLYLAPLSSYLSLLLIIGYIKFKSLRERPGDLILGISISSFVLTMYWTLSILLPELTQSCGCYASGIIVSLAGFANYIYNLAFIYYLRQKLQNLLTQARITKACTIHVVCLLLSSGFTVYLIALGSIGQNLFGTCSKLFNCDANFFTGSIVVVFYLFYEIFSISLYYYIKKSFGRAIHPNNGNNGGELFVDNYRVYLLITTILWLVVAVGIAYSEFLSAHPDSLEDNITTLTKVFVSVCNFCGVLQSIVLTIYRYRDPLIRNAMTSLVFFCKKRNTENQLAEPEPRPRNLSEDLGHHENSLNRSLIDPAQSSGSLDSLVQTNLVERFSKKRKLDLTYSVLCSIVIAYLDPSYLSDEMFSLSERLNQTVIYDIDEDTVFGTLANSKKEFQVAKCHVIPTKVHMIAPGIFKEFIKQEFGIDGFLKSLDLGLNRAKIRQDNKGDGGKSGEFFFFSSDNRLLIKSISNEEMNSLLRILGGYHDHVEKKPDTLIARIYGVLKLEWQYHPLNLIIMRNVCPYPKAFIEKTFDMKGSTYDRQVLKGKQYKDPKLIRSKTLKDSDFLKLEQSIRAPRDARLKILYTIKEDLEFLWKSKLIDYSLILFIVNKEKYLASSRKSKNGSIEDLDNSIGNWQYCIPVEGHPELCYSIGIIDLLQKYTFQKKMEKNVKKIMKLDPSLDTSSQNPTCYKERFWGFVVQILGFQGENIESL